MGLWKVTVPPNTDFGLSLKSENGGRDGYNDENDDELKYDKLLPLWFNF